jgi:hypothetical protein
MMSDRIRCAVLGIIFLTTATVSAQHTVVVRDSIDEQIFTLNQVAYLIDSTNNLSITEVTLPSFSQEFRQHDYYVNSDFRPNSSYWIRLPIEFSATTEKVWLLEFYDQTIDHLEVFVPVAGGYKRILMGDHYPFLIRRFDHKNFEVQLSTDPNPVTIYFRVRSHEFADIRFAVRSADRFIPRANVEYFLYGTFYGMVLIITLYNLLVYLAIREIKNLIYIAYILSVALFAMSLDGIGFQYLWSDFPAFNDYAAGIALYSVIIWALVFTRRFLRTRATSPRLDKILKWLIILRSVLLLAAIFVDTHLFSYRIIDIVPLSIIFYTGVKVWYAGYRPARFFVIAYGMLFLGFFIRTLVYFDVVPFSTPSHYSLHFSFVLEMLFLTFALGDRIRILKAMRDRAHKRIIRQHEENMKLKDTVNRELELKVQERTEELSQKNQELEDSNQKLVRQAYEINQINSMLDLDNWKLKNRIKEVLNERLHEKAMDYKQFQTLYPDRLACYRFLEGHKWEKGFSCRKCGNEKFFPGAQKFARRCTRCGYNESITAFTIFHSIKFPIEKAFYLAYLVVTGKQEQTLEALASVLEIGVNTVWNFKTKVQERIDELNRHGKRVSAAQWEDIILEPSRNRAPSVKTLESTEK